MGVLDYTWKEVEAEMNDDERKLYFNIKEQSIKWLRAGQPFTYTWRLSQQGKKMYGINPWKSFWYGTNAGLDHYRLTKQLFPKYAKYNSCRHAANKTLDYIIDKVEEKNKLEEFLK